MANKNDFPNTPEYVRAEKAALRLIARAEQCSAGLMRKLEKRKTDPAAARAVIARLTEMDLIDDRRFARLWFESRLRLTRSPRRLLSSLCARGIDRDCAEAAIKTALDEETEFSLLRRFAKKYAKKAARRGDSEDGERPLKYMLKNEGFSQTAIQRFFDEEA